ncbi:MAG: sigma-70 family RNA polymerase sigma factor [Ruminococcaceae bacterium]|nr:sigma-70 family RNA polymerase sigma factor [Oscillospiraceae bacterium]
MEDFQIVKLYWARNELAITESDRKYGRMLRQLSYSCLSSHQDAEECVNDTWLDAWNAMPPQRPTHLGAFLAKITRRISIDRFRRDHRQKRGGLGAITEELTDCIPDSSPTPADAYENKRLTQAINRFLSKLPDERRVMFVQRYFYAAPISQIARELNLSESNVKVTLLRLREALRQELGKEDLL